MVGTYNLIKEWNMVDVYFIGVLISLIKFEELTTLRFDSGFIYIVIFIAMFYLTTNLFNAKDVILDYSPKKYDKNSLMKSSLFIFLAIIFVIPAFLLPIIPTFKFSVAYMNTLFDGIISFYKDGDYFISFVILFTSIIIPLVKISGVVIMIIMAKYNVLKRYAKLMTSYYNLTDGIGKYSMLDVYVVVVSGSFMQFDQLLRIESGAAVLPFTLVVVFTMMASKAFDTRLLWENK
jgi:paraquat-inducible protein A